MLKELDNVEMNPKSINKKALQSAREWEEKMNREGVYRSHFFQEITLQIEQLCGETTSILEVGSGPGHLAECIIKTGKVKKYTLFDLSEAMNYLAIERLKPLEIDLVSTVGNFLSKQSFQQLGSFDVVVCMQSIHEAGDKKLAVDIYNNIIDVICPGGYFLVCDFFYGEQGMQNAAMYMTISEQKDALQISGFSSPILVSTHSWLTLYSAQKSA